jgi:hypothetical protein
MKCFSLLVLLILPLTAFAQEKTNEDINRQIRQLGVDKITLTFDQPSNMSKVMAVSENFSNRDADAAGVQAINFAMGFFYPGTSLKRSPETIHFSFWVLTKKPRFAEAHHLTVDLDGRTLDLGDARYAAKPRQNLEYLNFELKRSDLAAIGLSSKATFRFGTTSFSSTASQLKLIKATAELADSNNLN